MTQKTFLINPLQRMKQEFFLSQRLGFSNAQAKTIREWGIEKFLEKSLDTPSRIEPPQYIAEAPKNRREYRDMRQADDKAKLKAVAVERLRTVSLSHFWLEKMYTDSFPLREKMVLFWHNHFVSDIQKIKTSWAMWQQNKLFRDMAFGNYKELTRRILYDNAMLLYLDNNQNKAKAPNENLSRELLELFTLGVGNYTEGDIKAGAKALAGLNIGDDGGRYYRVLEDNTEKTYLNRTGNWKADDLVNIIFEQPKIGNRLMEKFLKSFMTDPPSVSIVEEYGEAFRKADFEMQPMFKKLIRDDRFYQSQGAIIKDPISFLLGSLYTFQLDLPPLRAVQPFFVGQGMKLLNPPNVKGWDGGRSWLSSQKLLQRVNLIALIANGKPMEAFRPKMKQMDAAEELGISEESMFGQRQTMAKIPTLRWDKSLTKNKDIIRDLTDSLVFEVSKDLQTECEQILKYDFDPKAENANQSVTRLAEHIMKSPEYQIS
jgi:uncharacterized protein (DUF1800 family)